MTYREKVAIEQPLRISAAYAGGVQGCPEDIMTGDDCPYSPTSWGCPRSISCRDCWDREIPETEKINVIENSIATTCLLCGADVEVDFPSRPVICDECKTLWKTLLNSVHGDYTVTCELPPVSVPLVEKINGLLEKGGKKQCSSQD